MDKEQELTEGQPSEATEPQAALDSDFELVPPEADEADGAATDAPADDDSDAPIRLDELVPDGSASDPAQDTVAVGPGPQAVRAESVTISQGSAQSIEASTVSITQGAAANVSADEFSVRQGAVGLARVENLTLESESTAFAVVAQSASVDEGASVFLLISRSVTGGVRPVLDWRAALGIGAGAALVLSILRRIR